MFECPAYCVVGADLRRISAWNQSLSPRIEKYICCLAGGVLPLRVPPTRTPAVSGYSTGTKEHPMRLKAVAVLALAALAACDDRLVTPTVAPPDEPSRTLTTINWQGGT